MEASILDLRYHIAKVLQALERNEEVKIYYHGKLKGILSPARPKSTKKAQEHPFFGMYQNESESFAEVMNKLRGERYHPL